jgi:hypothetical protein
VTIVLIAAGVLVGVAVLVLIWLLIGDVFDEHRYRRRGWGP